MPRRAPLPHLLRHVFQAARHSARLKYFVLACWTALRIHCQPKRKRETAEPPNIIVIFIDDMGYADIGPFGARTIRHQSRSMARDGMRFTDFVVSSAVCSASRAGLMTGCYHRARSALPGALGPAAQVGIHADEVTLGELCRQQGYATAVFGKWHLGHHPKFLPLQNGFDEILGCPIPTTCGPSILST